MAKLILKDVPPHDGEYELDIDQEYSGHELHLIKKVAGVRLNEIQEAAQAGDYDLFVSLAVITLWRSGKVKREDAPQLADMLLEAPTGALTFDFRGEDARPPEQTSEKPDENRLSSTPSSNGHSDDHPETTPAPIGLPG